jgi:hypothetical protein
LDQPFIFNGDNIIGYNELTNSDELELELELLDDSFLSIETDIIIVEISYFGDTTDKESSSEFSFEI